ncbi:MAG: hypothetical protein AAFZ65_05275 [Planctomycetota bacterium]
MVPLGEPRVLSSIQLFDVRSKALGIDSLDVASAASARLAIEGLDALLDAEAPAPADYPSKLDLVLRVAADQIGSF